MPTLRGLLIEGVGSNLIRNSLLAGTGTISNWNPIVSGSRAPAPSTLGSDDGAQAWALTATSQRPFFETEALTLADSTDYVLSFWVEQLTVSGGNNNIVHIVGAGTGAVGIDLPSTAVASTRPTRVAMKFTTGTGLVAGGVRVRIGLGAVDVATGTMTFSRPQLELAETRTSFMPSDVNATGIRSSDIVVKSTTEFPFNSTQGSFVVEFRSPLLYGTEGVIVQVDGGNEGTRISLMLDASGTVRLVLTNGGTQLFSLSGGAVAPYVRHKAAFRYGASDWALSVDGSTPVTNTTAAMPTGLTTLRRGHGVNSRYLNAELSMLTCYRSKRTNATLQADSALVTQQTGKKIIRYQHQLGLATGVSSILANYNVEKSWSMYTSVFDSNKDGIWDGAGASSTQSGLSRIGSTTLEAVYDWETIVHPTYGKYRVPGVIGGWSSTGGTTVRTFAQNEYVKVLNYFRGQKPQAEHSIYWWPNANNPLNWLNYSGAIANQHVVGDPVNRLLDAIHPRHYCTWGENFDAGGFGVMTRANLKTASENMATEAIKCALASPRNPTVLPFVSRIYYSDAFSGQEAPAEWIYLHSYYFCQHTFSGKKADGVYIWDGSSSRSLTEADLKLFYQAANGLPRDPNMPRPSL